MGLISPTQITDGTTANASDVNDPINTIANEFNGNIDNANIKTGAAIATAKLASDAGIVAGMIASDAVTDAKLVYGKVRTRQGGSATNWSTTGTTTYDYSATTTFFQCGASAINANPTTITFPTAFNQVPIVICQSSVAASANAFPVITAISATQFSVRMVTDAGAAATTEPMTWIAIGE